MTGKRLTLVTSLFDLDRREPEAGRRRSAEYYLKAGKWVCGIDRDMVIYCDPELAEPIAVLRAEAGMAPRTKVVPVPFEELDSYSRLERFEAAEQVNPVRNANPHKDTAHFKVAMRAKFELVERAMAEDPFAGTHFGWIDFGVLFRPHPADDPFADPPDRIRLLQMRGATDDEFADEHEYLRWIRGINAASYMCGSRASWERFARLALTKIDDVLDEGFAPLEEMVLPLLVRMDPELFEFFPGDYYELFLNYLHLRGGADNLLFQMRGARTGENEAHSWWVAGQILDALDAGTFEADPAMLARLLDECFLAAWAHGGKDAAAPVAERFRRLVEAEPAARDVFLTHEVRMRSNLELVES